MPNDLDVLSAGEVQTYSPSQPLAPAPDWGTTELTNHEYQRYTGGGQMILGQPLPVGVSIEQVMHGYQQLGNVFVSDFMKLGHNVSQTQKAVKWFIDALTNPPKQQQQRHSYNLFEHTNDPIFQAFANYAYDNGFSAKFVQDACWWITEASKRLGESQDKPAQGRAPTSASGRPDELSDTEYNALYDYNEKMKPYTEGMLRDKWGNAYHANLRMVDEYLQSLSTVEKAHFDRFLNNGLHALNDPTVIIGLWGQAVGINNIPRGGAELANEINMMHDAMKNNRKQWLSDERMQSRYRELIRIRDGG